MVSSRRRRRLLRPRGDRPCTAATSSSGFAASPPTRRSTRAGACRWTVRRGFSAHAEIDPFARPFEPAKSWLLRPRGDRPTLLCATTSRRVASPPTRRSTLQAGQRRRRIHGFSAHAEIDPRHRAVRYGCRGLLRPRGDRPATERGNALSGLASPPTRRSTRCFSCLRDFHPGFSAHAEIDPTGRERTRSPAGLLRPRGDRPAERAGTVLGRRASPPTRRSTPMQYLKTFTNGGFSAHAEIDP